MGRRGEFLAHLGVKHKLVEMFISVKEIEAGAAVKEVAKEAHETPNENDKLLDSSSSTQKAPAFDKDIIDEDVNDDCDDDSFKTACDELPGLTPFDENENDDRDDEQPGLTPFDQDENDDRDDELPGLTPQRKK